MQDQSKREKLIMQYKNLLRQSKEAATSSEAKRLHDLASQKHKEILKEEFEGDENIGRFNSI